MTFSYHAENTRYNSNMAKCRTKPNKNRWKHKPNQGGFELVKPDEVLEKLSELGINASKRSLQDYAKKGLISKPKTKGLGQGLGSFSDYSDKAHFEYYASWQFMHGLKLRSKDVADYRKLSLIIDDAIDHYHDTVKEPDTQGAINYFTEKILEVSSDEIEAKMAEFWWLLSKGSKNLRIIFDKKEGDIRTVKLTLDNK